MLLLAFDATKIQNYFFMTIFFRTSIWKLQKNNICTQKPRMSSWSVLTCVYDSVFFFRLFALRLFALLFAAVVKVESAKATFKVGIVYDYLPARFQTDFFQCEQIR